MKTTATHIEELYDRVKNYTKDSLELYKLNTIDKIADMLSSLTSRITLIVIVALFTIFINISISLFIGDILASYSLGFLILSGFYLLLGLCVYFFKKQLIETPISNMVIKTLLKSKA